MKPYPLLLLLFLLVVAALICACTHEADPPISSASSSTSQTAPQITPTTTTSTVSVSSVPDNTTFEPVLTTGDITTPNVTSFIPPVVTTPMVTTFVTSQTPSVTTTQKPEETLPPEPIDNPWTVTCNEFISLRRKPSTAARVLTRIPVGETVDVLEFVNGKFAKVRWNRKTGYVLSAYLTRSPEIGSSKDLSVVKPVQNYSYEQMRTDLQTLAQMYPNLLTLSSIGKSEEGRDLTLAILGNPDADRKLFLQASIHGREHIGTLLTLCEIDYLLSHQAMVLEDGTTVGELLSQIAIHIVPMSNPDGVTISQTGILPEKFKKMYGNSPEIAKLWKANAKGIDLNANFDADWKKYESIYESNSPAFAGYKGTAPECAAESRALANYLRANEFDLILSYHTSGSLIYWSYNYNKNTAVNKQCYDVAKRLAEYTGYVLGEQDSDSTAGLKDYAIQGLKTPSITMEFALADAPAPISEFEQIWARGKHTMLISAQWVIEQK